MQCQECAHVSVLNLLCCQKRLDQLRILARKKDRNDGVLVSYVFLLLTFSWSIYSCMRRSLLIEPVLSIFIFLSLSLSLSLSLFEACHDSQFTFPCNFYPSFWKLKTNIFNTCVIIIIIKAYDRETEGQKVNQTRRFTAPSISNLDLDSNCILVQGV